MMQKKFVFCQLSRYVCTRRIQFLLQDINVILLSNNDDVICCFVSRSKDIFTVQSLHFLFSAFTERLRNESERGTNNSREPQTKLPTNTLSEIQCEMLKEKNTWLSPITKVLTPTENSKRNVITQKHHKKSITKRLRTDLGRSVGVTTSIQLVWLKLFTGSKPFNQPQKQCYKKDSHLNVRK